MTTKIAEMMASLGVTSTSLARVYSELGDPADLATIQRRISRRMKPDVEPSGESIAFLNLLLQVRTAISPLDLIIPREPPDGRRRPRSPR